MTGDLADLDQDAETPAEDEVYQDGLEGTGHVSDADAGADAATLEDLDNYVIAQVHFPVVGDTMQHGRVGKNQTPLSQNNQQQPIQPGD